jgi:diguanylate cyclase (GGDEF)-like protein
MPSRPEADVVIHARSGRNFSIEYTVAPIIVQSNDTLMGAILVVRDVTQLRVITKELAYQVKHDMLTGLMNRRAFEHHHEIVMDRIPEQTDEPHWLCYLDLDQFNLINDTCGQLASDELLKRIARTHQILIRDVDLHARMGGDEFVILLNHCTVDDAAQTIEHIHQAINSMSFTWTGKTFGTSGSFGLVPITQENSTLYELMRAADTACYVAKDDSNRIHIYRVAMAPQPGVPVRCAG